MKTQFWLLLFVFSVCVSAAWAEAPSRLIEDLEAGKSRKLVVYGTSLTAGGPWVQQLRAVLDYRYPGQVTFVNSGQGGSDSTYGLRNLEKRVLAEKPDAVTIEFGMNDTATKSGLTSQAARLKAEAMIDFIHADLPDCEIILMTMNPVANKIAQRPPDNKGKS